MYLPVILFSSVYKESLRVRDSTVIELALTMLYIEYIIYQCFNTCIYNGTDKARNCKRFRRLFSFLIEINAQTVRVNNLDHSLTSTNHNKN